MKQLRDSLRGESGACRTKGLAVSTFLAGKYGTKLWLTASCNLGVRQGCEDADPNLRDSFYVKSSVMWNAENTAFASASIFQPDQQLASESSGNYFFLR